MTDRKLAVIKLGGHAMDHEALLEAFLADIESLFRSGWHFIIVHGGGPYIDALLKKLNIKSEFINGLRVTDANALIAVEMALCAQVNKNIVRRLLKAGVKAAGISGEDDDLLRAAIQDKALGLVGNVTEVHPEILNVLLNAHILPVVAPLALSENFEPLNVNADTAAGAIAGAMRADYFVLLSNVPGVQDCSGTLQPKLTAADLVRLRQDGAITAGMIPKVACCEAALAAGCARALILDGRQEHALANYLGRNLPQGTEIVP